MYGALRADTMIRQLQCMAPSWPPPVLRVEVGGLCARVASLIACWHEQRQCVCVCTVYGHDMWHRLIELVTVTNLLLSWDFCSRRVASSCERWGSLSRTRYLVEENKMGRGHREGWWQSSGSHTLVTRQVGGCGLRLIRKCSWLCAAERGVGGRGFINERVKEWGIRSNSGSLTVFCRTLRTQ